MGILATAAMLIKSEDVVDIIVIYKAMVDAMRLNNRLIEEGKRDKIDTVRYLKLEGKVDALWDKLTRDEQIVAVANLVKDGYMHEYVAEMIATFGGRINQNETPEPCIKIKKGE